jgi:hypothetical protein
MASSYKQTRNYTTTSHQRAKKTATEAWTQILANTSSTAMTQTHHLWPRDTKMMMMMIHYAFIVEEDRQEGGALCRVHSIGC